MPVRPNVEAQADADDRHDSSIVHGGGRGVWLVAATACAVASAAFWWYGLADAAFVSAALGVVAYFLNQRGKYRRIRDEHEHAQKQKTGEPADADERDD